MSTFTIRVSSSATNVPGTAWGQQPDQNAPSYLDLVVSNSTDPAIVNGVYDAYCLNPLVPISLSPNSYQASGTSGASATAFNPISSGSPTTLQVQQLNWLLSQNFTSDAKYGGQYNFGEVQVAIWKILGFTDAQISGSGADRFLSDNYRHVVNWADANDLVARAQAAIASGVNVLPTDAYFTAFIDPTGNVQPLVIQLQSAKLGNYVWLDGDRDGLQDAGEAGVDNVVVELYRVDGNGNRVFVSSTTTGDDYSTAAVEQGYYQFTGLAAGSYQLKFITPAYAFTGQDANANGSDAADSDVDAATGFSQVVALAAAESNQTIDAGLVTPAPEPAKISGYVYEDAGNDGSRAGDAPIAGVLLTLSGTDDLGQAVTATATTNAQGYYEFTGLRPGVYTVSETQPAAYLDGKDTVGTTGGDASVNDVLSAINLAAGQHSQENNFGELLPASLGDYVWLDNDNDGVQNDGATGLNGVTVKLLDAAGNALRTVVTANNPANGQAGWYLFEGLVPGEYKVEFVKPAGYIFAKQDVGADGADSDVNAATGQTVTTTLESGENDLSWDAGLVKLASLGDRVWVDADGDGQQDAGEAGVNGLTVQLVTAGTDGVFGTGDDVVEQTTTTAGDGNYLFEGLAPGAYQVQFDKPAGTVYTVADQGSDASDSDADAGTGRSQTVVLNAGDDNRTVDAGVYAPVSLGDKVWEDKDADGQQDAGEGGIDGVTVRLYNCVTNALVATQVTANGGQYNFTGLPPGTYHVVFETPSGFVQTTANVGGDDAADSDAGTNGVTGCYTLNSGESTTTVDAGFYKLASLGDYVWLDNDNDGVQNDGATGLNGVTVKLLDAAGNALRTVVTANNPANGQAGWYLFEGLVPGEYKVEFVKPAGYIFAKQDVGADGADSDVNAATGQTVTTTLESGENDLSWDAGLVKLASLGDKVWLDSNGNGQQDSGEAGVGNVLVKLLDANGAVLSTQSTNANGEYLFTDLAPGSYRVQFVTPDGYQLTTANGAADDVDSDAGAGGLTGTYVLNAGDANRTVDAGLVQPKAHIGDFVFLDKNANGVQDTGEAGIAGVTVNLKNAAGTVVATMLTGANGEYGFDVAPGTYSVQVVAPASYVVTGKDAGANDAADSDIDASGQTGSYTLAAGEVNNTVDAGLYQKAAIGDRIWYDKDADGIQDSGEAGIAGVKVELRDTANNILQTTTTDANGNYLFSNLNPGDYHIDVVESTLPAGSVFTLSNQGANDGADSDVRAAAGQPLVWGIMDNTTLESGETDRSWDAGVYKVAVDIEKYVSGTTCTTTNNCGGEGASSGYWKGNCSWQYDLGSYGWSGTGCKSSTSFNSLFGCNISAGSKSIYDVLCSTGTSALEVLMRECAAAYLNACHSKVDYAFTKDQVCAQTRYALNSGNYDSTCKAFAKENSAGCDWTTSKSSYNCTVDATLYDSDAPPGLEVKTGSTVTFTYIVKNTGDTALKNVVVTDDRIATVTYVSGDTDKDGLLDTNETWTYKATEVAQSGTIKNTGTVTAVDAVGGVASVTDQDDAYYTGSGAAKSSLGDRVWYDKDADGIQDSGEAGIAGVKVTLKGAGADGSFGTADDITASTTTSATGYYEFNNLNAGKYTVDFGDVAGYSFTRQNQGSNDAADSDANTAGETAVITLGSNEHNLTVDAGLYKVGIDVEKYVSGTRTTTSNNCGGEGASVGHWKGNCSWQSDLGGYGWSGTGCKSSTSFNSLFGCNISAGSKSIYDVLCSTGTSALEVLMRECAAAYLNACHDKVDYAYTKDQVCAQTRQALSCGNYDSTCKAFSYENSQGCNWTTTKTSYSCTVDATLYDSDAPPGLEVKTGSTVTFTYLVRNTGDTALKNVVLTDDRIATVSYVSGDTDNDGLLDTNETWTYKATEVAQSGTIKNTGTVTAVDAVGGVTGVTDEDDAYYTGQGSNPGTKGSIGDRVWEDKNYNGVQDTGETGLAGIKVVLKGAGADGSFGTADDITATTTTSATGAYEFTDLAAGKYQLVFGEGSSGLYVTKQNVGDDAKDSDIDATGTTGVITLAAGEHNLTVDAGAYRKACVGDKVWEDWDHDNVQDVGEGGIGGITVKLYTSTGTLVATTKTNSSGNYLFSNLDPGSYYLQFDKTNVLFYNSYWGTNGGNGYNMSYWKWALKDAGSNDAIDSDTAGDASSTTNVSNTSVFTLVSGQSDMTRDAGITPIVIDLDGDGIRTVAREDSDASFDLFGNGSAVRSGWLSGGDGFLAVDRNGNGRVDDIGELFGGNAKGAGFAQLAAFDGNGDGVVDARDAGFADLRIWQDANGNHATDDGELVTLAQAGIASLTVGYTELPFLDAQGNLHLERSSATRADGSSVDMTDVYFNVSADDAAAAGVALPTMADLLGNDASLDALLGGAAPVTTAVQAAADGAADCAMGDASETLRRLAALTQEACQTASAA